MKHCEPCDLDFPDAYRFCGSCGGPLSDQRRCPHCGELVDGKWTFCTGCGRSLSLEKTDDQATQDKTSERTNLPAAPASSPRASTPPPQTLSLPLSEQPATADRLRSEKAQPEAWYSDPDLLEEATTRTAAPPLPRQDLVGKTIAATSQMAAPSQSRDEKSAPSLTMLSAYGESETPSEFRWWHGAILALFVLLVIGGIGIGGWYWWSHRGSAAQTTPPVDTNTGALPENSSTSPSSRSTSTTTPGPPATSSADEEIKRLRERRIGAKPSQTSEIVAAFKDGEKKYPNDYRFPYEGAKLSIKGITTHHEAFGALAFAAAKAIDSGKSQEMLDILATDRGGDFYKLSRGHHQWQALEDALRNKDRTGLKMLHH